MENETPTTPEPELTDAEARYHWLRRQILAILILLIVVSATFNIFLLRQWRYASSDLKGLQGQVAPLMNEYQQIAPRLDEFLNRIREYGRTHPDFAPIMTKYQIPVPTSPPPASVLSPPKK